MGFDPFVASNSWLVSLAVSQTPDTSTTPPMVTVERTISAHGPDGEVYVTLAPHPADVCRALESIANDKGVTERHLWPGIDAVVEYLSTHHVTTKGHRA